MLALIAVVIYLVVNSTQVTTLETTPTSKSTTTDIKIVTQTNTTSETNVLIPVEQKPSVVAQDTPELKEFLNKF